MKLFQVRKGQFVYYQKELHKVYSIKYMYKQSIHLLKLKDMEQELSQAEEITKYVPQHMDSFRFNHKRYTLQEKTNAAAGDYILVTHASPDRMDSYNMNEIEKVESVEKYGVVTNRGNSVEHHEYMLMIPGRLEGCRTIDYEDQQDTEDDDAITSEGDLRPEDNPTIIGDVYEKVADDTPNVTMVVAIKDQRSLSRSW